MTLPRLGLIGALILAIVGIGLHEWRQEKAIDSQRALLPDPAVRELNLKLLGDAQSRIRTLQAKLAAQAPARKVAAPGSPAPAAPAQSRPRMTAAARDQYLVEYTRQRDAAFGPLFALLARSGNQTPAQLEQFKEALLQKQTAFLAAVLPGSDPTVPPRDRMLAARASAEESIKESLGDDGYALYRQYQATLPQRSAAGLVAQNLEPGATPLSADQTEKLVTIMAQNPAAHEVFRVPTLGMVDDAFAAPPSAVSPGAVAAAAGVLSADQLRALQLVQFQQQTRQQIYEWVGRVSQELHPPPPAGP